MTRFYEIMPLDTLFFRGATPMDAGQYNSVSLFPPPVSVLKGALWTAYCQRHGKSYQEGLEHGGTIPFKITGFFIKRQGDDSTVRYYIPAPATWYYDSEKTVRCGAECKGMPLCIAQDKSASFVKLGLEGSAGTVVFAVPQSDAKPLAGAWIDVRFVQEPQPIFGYDSVLFPGDIYVTEPRIGVALYENRRAKDGQLYTSTHIRLREGTSFVVAVEGDCDLEAGTMLLGGEQRIVAYSVCTENPFGGKSLQNGNGLRYLSPVPVVQASGVKGAFRANFELYKNKLKDNQQVKDFAKLTENVFGTATEGGYAGALSVSDAKILAYPMRSSVAPFVWITCPAVLKRLVKDAGIAGKAMAVAIPDIKKDDAQTVYGVETGKKVLLEDYEVNVFTKTDDKLSCALRPYLGKAERLLIASDEVFNYGMSDCTQIMAQISINEKTGTTSEGSLRYTEELPLDTIMYAVLQWGKSRDSQSEYQADTVRAFVKEVIGSHIQVGGDETLGRGIFELDWNE